MSARLELTMKNNIFILVFCFSAYFPKATTDSETVWLKDVTTRLQRDKRSLDDPDLPEKLSFLLKGKSHTLTLNLKRNYNVDPNADIYTVRNLADGRAILEKTVDVQKEDVAYYQDRENGAFMTARCVKRSDGKCDILISGNIRIGHVNYDLRPSSNDFASRNILENTHILGKRYVLQDQSNIERDLPYIQDLSNVKIDISRLQDQSNIERERDISLLQDQSNVEGDMQVLQDQFDIKNDESFLQDQENVEGDITAERKDKVKKEYYVKVLVIVDSSIWDLFISLVNASIDITKRASEAKTNIRKYYSHIMNGVDELYKGIQDPDIVINVKILGFVVYQWEAQFQHNVSSVETVHGIKMINGTRYLADLNRMDVRGAFARLPQYDQIILFTQHWMYAIRSVTQSGFSLQGRVCDLGYRAALVRSSDYFRTTSTAAHELGHSLGAFNDGEGDAAGCKADYGFIMSPIVKVSVINRGHSKNHWLFSTCSVNSFKKTLAHKDCVNVAPTYTQEEEYKWNRFIKTLPGEIYSPSMQCEFILGRGSKSCGVLPGSICEAMYCSHPETLQCLDIHFKAAPGTPCGEQKWCRQGLCVRKSPK